MSKTLKIPTAVRFGFKFTVPVQRVAKMPGKSGEYFFFDNPDGCRIDISGAEPTWEQIDAYGHEVVHAAIDFCRYLQREYVTPMRLEAERTAIELAQDKKGE